MGLPAAAGIEAPYSQRPCTLQFKLIWHRHEDVCAFILAQLNLVYLLFFKHSDKTRDLLNGEK